MIGVTRATRMSSRARCAQQRNLPLPVYLYCRLQAMCVTNKASLPLSPVATGESVGVATFSCRATDEPERERKRKKIRSPTICLCCSYSHTRPQADLTPVLKGSSRDGWRGGPVTSSCPLLGNIAGYRSTIRHEKHSSSVETMRMAPLPAVLGIAIR